MTSDEYVEIKQRLQGILDTYDGAELIYQLQDYLSHLGS